MFANLTDRFTSAFSALQGKKKLTDADIDTTCRQIRIALLEADVALPVVKTFIAAVKERARSEELSQALEPAEQIIKIVHDELITILGGKTRELTLNEGETSVVMLVGLQGAGKTTLAGKLAARLREQGKRPLLVAADLFRPNAVAQLRLNAQRAGVDIHAPEEGSGIGDPIEVARAGVELARAGSYDVVIVDTAGRTSVDAEQLAQAATIRDQIKPDETLLVLDAMTGQDAARTAQTFADQVGLTGLVLTKLDGDARGGSALSLAALSGKPVMFASTGEKLEDLEVFHPDRMASRILDMGDMLTLIEKAEKSFNDQSADDTLSKLAGDGSAFTLDDFLAQMQAVRAMGSLTKLAALIPGAGALREQLESLDDRELDRTVAIIKSMSPQERANPELLDDKRLARVARGAGRDVEDVRVLVERFFESRQMMVDLVGQSRFARRAGGKARRSGNPAKRAAVTG